MVQHKRYHQMKKGRGDEQSQKKTHAQTLVLELWNCKRTHPRLLPLLFFFFSFSFVSCSFFFVPRIINSCSLDVEHVEESKYPLCSSMSSGSICCDRTSTRSDICFMKGDVRTHSDSSTFFLYPPSDSIGEEFNGYSSNYTRDEEGLVHEKIRPYTRKWETSIMDTIAELNLVVKKKGPDDVSESCDVHHSVPAIVFSTGGYTGNVYHEFNDGIVPLYITSQHLKKNVVFVVVDYHEWWRSKYGDVLSRLSNYPLIDFNKDKRTHCFPEAIVGLRIHDELAVDSSLMQGGKSIGDFHNLLEKAYRPRIRGMIRKERAKRALYSGPTELILENVEVGEIKKPKLVILSRSESRAILNQDLLVKMAEDIGFKVKVLQPDKTTELAKIYRVLNSSDAMIGVHGAALTHFLFLKPGSVFIQVVPLGTDWAAETYYGEPSRKLGLNYIGYKILPVESSLHDKYSKDDPILKDPSSVTKKGWHFTKTIYLDGQNVNLDLARFRERLVRAYDYTISKRSRGHS